MSSLISDPAPILIETEREALSYTLKQIGNKNIHLYFIFGRKIEGTFNQGKNNIQLFIGELWAHIFFR